MAFLASNNHHLLVSILMFTFVSSCKFGRAYDYPHIGAAGVIADKYLAKADIEGEKDQFFPQGGIIGTGAALIFNKALQCLNDKHIYSSCDEAHRLTQSGELNVPTEYTDEYCNGACLTETHHALDCIDSILKRFIFYNGARLSDLRETLESGCSYGPKRGNFNVLEHVQADDANKNRASRGVVYGLVMMVFVSRVLF